MEGFEEELMSIDDLIKLTERELIPNDEQYYALLREELIDIKSHPSTRQDNEGQIEDLFNHAKECIEKAARVGDALIEVPNNDEIRASISDLIYHYSPARGPSSTDSRRASSSRSRSRSRSRSPGARRRSPSPIIGEEEIMIDLYPYGKGSNRGKRGNKNEVKKDKRDTRKSGRGKKKMRQTRKRQEGGALTISDMTSFSGLICCSIFGLYSYIKARNYLSNVNVVNEFKSAIEAARRQNEYFPGLSKAAPTQMISKDDKDNLNTLSESLLNIHNILNDMDYVGSVVHMVVRADGAGEIDAYGAGRLKGVISEMKDLSEELAGVLERSPVGFINHWNKVYDILIDLFTKGLENAREEHKNTVGQCAIYLMQALIDTLTPEQQSFLSRYSGLGVQANIGLKVHFSDMLKKLDKNYISPCVLKAKDSLYNEAMNAFNSRLVDAIKRIPVTPLTISGGVVLKILPTSAQLVYKGRLGGVSIMNPTITRMIGVMGLVTTVELLNHFYPQIQEGFTPMLELISKRAQEVWELGFRTKESIINHPKITALFRERVGVAAAAAQVQAQGIVPSAAAAAAPAGTAPAGTAPPGPTGARPKGRRGAAAAPAPAPAAAPESKAAAEVRGAAPAAAPAVSGAASTSGSRRSSSRGQQQPEQQQQQQQGQQQQQQGQQQQQQGRQDSPPYQGDYSGPGYSATGSGSGSEKRSKKESIKGGKVNYNSLKKCYTYCSHKKTKKRCNASKSPKGYCYKRVSKNGYEYCYWNKGGRKKQCKTRKAKVRYQYNRV